MSKTEEFQRRTSEVFDLSESIFSVEEDTGKMTARVRIIKAGKSKNGRNYRESALRSAVDRGIFNGVRMFVNHSKTPPLQRSLTEMVSAIESTSYHETDKAIDANVTFFDEKFFNFARKAAPFMGDSINAMVQGTRTRLPSGRVEEDIHQIVQPHSVDWVIYPAAGGEILAIEGEGNMPEIDWSSITLDDLKTNAPAVVEALQAELKPAVQPTPITGLTEEQVERLLIEKMTAYDQERRLIAQKQEAAAAQVRDAFSRAGLPEKTQRRLVAAFEGITEFDEAAVQAAITEAKEELAAAGAGPKITGMGPSGGEGGQQAPSFSVRESVESFFGTKKN